MVHPDSITGFYETNTLIDEYITHSEFGVCPAVIALKNEYYCSIPIN